MIRDAIRFYLSTLFLLSIVIAALVAWDVWHFLEKPLDVGERKLFEIPPGASLTMVSRKLVNEGYIVLPHHAYYLAWYGRLRGQAGRLQAGQYEVKPDTTPLILLDDMVSGRAYLHALAVIDGWTFQQMMSAIAADPNIVHSVADLSADTVMKAMGHPGEHPEGRFYPDTYRFPSGTKDVDFLRRAYDTMAHALEEEWNARAPDLPLTTSYEALTLASIVQRESALPVERFEIAGVFVRRLRSGMRLQTDPTVIYGMGSAYNGNIRLADLSQDTPYNTYTRDGLPPTPICFPGREAIHAALHPADGSSLYFVAKGDGSHVFSTTIEEHNAAVKRYQLKQTPSGSADPDTAVPVQHGAR